MPHTRLLIGCGAMMINSTSVGALDAIEVPLSRADKLRILKAYLRELSGGLLASFLVTAFVSTGFVWLVLRLWTNYQSTSLMALAIAAVFGAVVVVFLLLKESKYTAILLGDLRNGTYQQISVKAQSGIAVDMQNGQPAIALDCGSHTLVLSGNWWRNRTRRDVWTSDAARLGFPSDSFILSRLKSSGRVFSVRADGRRLPIKSEKPIDPELGIELGPCRESHVIERSLGSIPMQRTSRQTLHPKAG